MVLLNCRTTYIREASALQGSFTEFLPQPSPPTQFLSPYTIPVHHPELLFLNFWKSGFAMLISPSVWAGTGLLRVRVVGVWHRTCDEEEVIVLGCVGNIPFLWGYVEEVALALSPSLGSIHPFSLCDPMSQVSKARKWKDLMNRYMSHRNLKFWKKLKETFLFCKPWKNSENKDVFFYYIQSLWMLSIINLNIKWKIHYKKLLHFLHAVAQS